ncbi:MAG: CCA tRNA nucleotidyltransferase [Candidatus Jettenia sp.]|uniref:Phosphohydrolase n=1 Tax=Candidatus Jettenia caeni TaxID=247490 RepID=I3ILI7_9BACT|nr:CCA tRNA nucleotidyltransferase [Candidatus Jettenia sp. AMX1]MBC6927394.1 CCA tRNA nucleotidyltransferase [Candidatus Jettenia sp.]WKZ14412.1 MAG: CCA tRNA nucleotidyltransferase [Candidatus Jettenia caeni]KAA0251769.1 MAG: CCA tRNA nucleotidyltransferase [Candidatus Jettenia sp. AMX1]MCE7879077.1 CCA tRNA nucleotidyltransferase [Candidatus Jettenia sp. AMX1]MCQ3925823.1 CCA tRNA nucleotidyltransferase [Candidatus Jettenia sp.]
MTIKQYAVQIVQTLQKHGYKAFLAGGCVRDMIMGKESFDYDIATDAMPHDVIRIFQKTIPVGIQFGVVIVVKEGHNFEVATFRTEDSYSDGRHPDRISFSTPENDVKRRDFTINGLLYDPVKDEILDYVGGRKDIEAGIVRTIGDPIERFTEDKLRMIRAARFACRFHFSIHKDTQQAIMQLAPQIHMVSAERIREELEKIITGPNPHIGIKLLEELHLLQEILPEVSNTRGVQQPENFHPEGDVFIHTLLALSKMENPSWTLAMGVLLHDIGKAVTFTVTDRIRFNLHEKVGADMATEICDRLKTSTDDKERIRWLVLKHLCFKDAQKMRLNKLKRLFAEEGYPELAELCRADALASSGDLSDYDYCQEMFQKLSREEVKPEPLITGHDLIAMGLQPGPLFKEILTKIEDEQLDGNLTTKEAAIERVKELFMK